MYFRKFHLVALLFFTSLTASAFTVAQLDIYFLTFYAADNHEQITRTALLKEEIRPEAVIKRTGIVTSFEPKAAREVELANRETDSNSYNIPWVHFDDENGALTTARILEFKEAIIRLAKEGDFVSSRSNLGFTLHSIQDFYSHSNWTEEHGAVVNPSLGVSSFSATSGSATCRSNAYLKGAPLTTGYFSYAQAKPGVADYWTNTNQPIIGTWPDFRCVHGNSSLRNSDVHGAGINKDSAIRSGFSAARDAAEGATAKFVKEIVAELNGHDNALCGFFGQEASPACAGVELHMDVDICCLGRATALNASVNTPSGTPSDAPKITGSLTFYDRGDRVLCTATVAPDGRASCSGVIGGLPNQLTARYSGNANWPAVESSVTINKIPGRYTN